MNQLLAFLNQGWVGSLLGIFGIATGYLFFLASRKRKILRYEINTNILIKNFEHEIDGLQISYHNKPIKNLAVTRAYLWNAGRDVIRKSDIPSADPIGFFVQGSLVGNPKLEPLDPKNRNQFELKYGRYENGFTVEFSHIAFRDTCQIQFFHTFLDEQVITVSGSVIGSGKPEKGKFIGAVDTVVFLFNIIVLCLSSLVPLAVLLYIQDRLSRWAGIDPTNVYLFSPDFSFKEFFITP